MACNLWITGRLSSINQELALWQCIVLLGKRNCDLLLIISLNAIQNIGQLAALPFCALACDHFGRKKTLVFGASILLVGVVLQAAAQNTGMFIAARGIIGFGLAFNITAAPILIMELAFPTQKAQMVSIYNTLWNLGYIAASWTTYGTFRITSNWAWRIPSLLQAISSIIQILCFFWIVESPRWLVSKDRIDEARDIICHYHGNSNPSDPIVMVELEEIRAAIRLENEASKSTSYASFFQTKGNRLRFAIILAVGFFSQWSGNGLISYYLTLILDSIGYTGQETQTLINGLLAIWSLVTCLFFSLIVNRFRRRTMFLTSTITMLITFIIWTGLQSTYEKQVDATGTGNPHVAKGVLAMIFLYSLAFNIGWTPLQVTYVVEILPYNLRARVSVLSINSPTSSRTFNQTNIDFNPSGTSTLQPLRSLRTDFQPIRQSRRHHGYQVEILHCLRHLVIRRAACCVFPIR